MTARRLCVHRGVQRPPPPPPPPARAISHPLSPKHYYLKNCKKFGHSPNWTYILGLTFSCQAASASPALSISTQHPSTLLVSIPPPPVSIIIIINISTTTATTAPLYIYIYTPHRTNTLSTRTSHPEQQQFTDISPTTGVGCIAG